VDTVAAASHAKAAPAQRVNKRISKAKECCWLKLKECKSLQKEL
jgi:hypothetical protein